MTRRTQYFAPTYAAGHSLVPSSLELMIAQAIFNPTNIECLQTLMCSTDESYGNHRNVSPANKSNVGTNIFLVDLPKTFVEVFDAAFRFELIYLVKKYPHCLYMHFIENIWRVVECFNVTL